MAGVGALLASPALAKIEAAKSIYSTDAAPNTLEDLTSNNNFYDFGIDKGDPAAYASSRPILGRS